MYNSFVGVLPQGTLAPIASQDWTCPLGLVLIGTAIRRQIPETTVKIYNLWITAEQEVLEDIQRLASDQKVLAGITMIAGNGGNALKLAQKLHTAGCDVILGGPDITKESATYYASLPMIDHVIAGRGEKIVPQIMKGEIDSPVTICGSKVEDFDSQAVDYSFLHDLQRHDGVSYLWGGDCFLSGKKRCVFCGRQERGIGCRRNMEAVWKELHLPFENNVVRYYNTADSVGLYRRQLQAFREARPAKMASCRHKMFLNAREANDEIAETLHGLNAIAAIGVESFVMINAAEKGKTTAGDSLRAIKILHRHSVPMILTFVLGLPGETKESLETNKEELIRVLEKYGSLISGISLSPLLVLAGSRAYDQISRVGIERGPNGEFYDPVKLSKLYCQLLCDVGREEIIEHIGELVPLIRQASPNIIIDSKGIIPEEYACIM